MTDISEMLLDNESVELELEGVASGYTRWSGLGGIVGIVMALTVPRALNLSFWVGVVSILVVVTAVFLLVYYFIGRRIAANAEPPSETPYLLLVLTNRRVFLFDRGLGGEAPVLLEEANRNSISAVRYGAAGMLVPQRLGFVIKGNRRREFEFARPQPVKKFVEKFE